MLTTSRTLRTRASIRVHGTTLYGTRSAPAPRRAFGSWKVSSTRQMPTRSVR
ncbi:MAG: hypothetical protein AAGK21_17390 [Bacteroidota bacterium]